MEYSRNFYQIRSNEEILEDLKDEMNYVGYFDLPYKSTEKIKEFAKSVNQKNIFVVGIGGSSLGSKAIYKFLKTSRKFNKKIFFLDTIDPLRINYLLSLVDLDNSYFLIISKSGETIEPISIFKYLSSKVDLNSSNLSVITGKDSSLYVFAKDNNLNYFLIDENVGGRFSVFSPVGLVPMAILGIDIDAILEGCKEVHESFFKKGYFFDLIINKARFLVENKSRFNINIIFSYSSVFSDFNKWYVQIWAESLGKINKNGTRQGLTPVALLGPDDQHSFLQLIVDGVRDKTVTFFKINNLEDSSIIPSNKKFDMFNSEFADGKSFNNLINLQADATYQAILDQKDIPCDIITIDQINEKNIAKLMYRFQLLVSSIGSFLQINTYDQPGVEHGKKILKSKFQSD